MKANGVPDRAVLPLRTHTDDRWAVQALADPFALLNDHAFLERKAALNAMELLHRWPERGGAAAVGLSHGADCPG